MLQCNGNTIYLTYIDQLCPRTTYEIAFNQLEDNDTILELGCATGYWGQFAKNNKNIEIYGLDYLDFHVENAKNTNCYNEVIQYDLNHLDDSLARLNNTFDKIVILDVLEHLYNPEAVLLWCKNFLKPNGKIITSIPNIAHKSIIHQLLLGQFNYTSSGLLDSTHIRFFTKSSFEQLLDTTNFEIIKQETTISTTSDYEASIPEEINNYINNLPEADAFQYVFVVKNKE